MTVKYFRKRRILNVLYIKVMDLKQLDLLKKAFGKNLQKIRENKKMSLLEVSYNCSLDESKISKIEHGRFNITLSTMAELAKGLSIHQKQLLEFDFVFED